MTPARSVVRPDGRALEGIRVLDVTQVMAGPFCAMQLCDMGADVIKVEPPDGDPTRQMGARVGTDSAGFAAVNRGKRGIVLDLKSPAGRDAFVRLGGARRHPDRELPARRDAPARTRLSDAVGHAILASSTRRSPATARPDPTRRRAASISSRRASPD